MKTVCMKRNPISQTLFSVAVNHTATKQRQSRGQKQGRKVVRLDQTEDFRAEMLVIEPRRRIEVEGVEAGPLVLAEAAEVDLQRQRPSPNAP